MALDKLVDSKQLDTWLKGIGDAIRGKVGTTETFPTAEAMQKAIDAIQAGGGVDPAPFKAIEVLTWTPASDTDKNIFQASINPMACFFTAVPGYRDDGNVDAVDTVGWGAAFALNTPFVESNRQTVGVAFVSVSSSLFDARVADLQTKGKEFQLSLPYGGLKFKAGREYIITVFEI